MARAYPDKELIEKIKKKITKKVLCESVKTVYDFLKDYQLTLEDCVTTRYGDKYLKRQNFYGKSIIRYASTSDYAHSAHHYYLICNKTCKGCKNKIKCGIEYNGYIYQHTIGGMFNDI